MLVRGVGEEGLEVVGVFDGSILRSVEHAIGRHFEAEHVEIADVGDHGLDQVGCLGQGCAHKQATIAAALNGELFRRGILLVDEPARASDEIVEHVLLVVQHARLVPGFAEFAATTQVANHIDAASLEPDRQGAAESGRLGNVETTIPGQERWVASIERQSFRTDDVQRDFGSIFRDTFTTEHLVGAQVGGGSCRVGGRRELSVFGIEPIDTQRRQVTSH